MYIHRIMARPRVQEILRKRNESLAAKKTRRAASTSVISGKGGTANLNLKVTIKPEGSASSVNRGTSKTRVDIDTSGDPITASETSPSNLSRKGPRRMSDETPTSAMKGHVGQRLIHLDSDEDDLASEAGSTTEKKRRKKKKKTSSQS